MSSDNSRARTICNAIGELSGYARFVALRRLCKQRNPTYAPVTTAKAARRRSPASPHRPPSQPEHRQRLAYTAGEQV
ncbi:protein of unknown function [Cupriavidus taiwanensis]|uniref:Uncharacterized protein n=1 Tax=Cupriavidus taiwanensis TaxID=164546 RepID=A0A375I8B6_9BURK|nr:hypothetical protein CBM2588_A180216 [Cupriavidus taiwanensis]SOY50834.1 hypothetical protein CBM2592_A230067 [Cupriavidus taiwanensis]SOY83725.1 hypothetical protein CBM2591_A270077 [Cupriavidus taiwanensis]SOZ57950.1 hypothetical protein CBM2617_A260070 [Cupriavidus taiwanensis]SOZ79760.1 hypothetical protein CBM2618_A230073 [Cupriavidus taiwanensis]